MTKNSFGMSGDVTISDEGVVQKYNIKTIDILPPTAGVSCKNSGMTFADVAKAHAQRLSDNCMLLRTKVNEDSMIVLDPKPVAPSVDYVDPEGNTHVHIHLISEPIGETLPGWYYSDECQILCGPYGTLVEAEKELDNYVKVLNEECNYNFKPEPEPKSTKSNEPGSWDPTGDQSKYRLGREPKPEIIFTYSHGEVVVLKATIEKLERDLEATKVQLVTAELVARNLLAERDAKPKMVAGVHYEGRPATLEDLLLFQDQLVKDNTVLHHPV